MLTVAIFVAILVVLFSAAFVAKRRFGLLGLALTAGWVLSDIWKYDAGLLFSIFGVPVNPLSTAVILCLIVMLPAIVLLFHGYTYKMMAARIIGSLFFAILALAFLVDPIGHALAPDGIGLDVYNWLMANRLTIIGLGVTLAVVDLFFTKPASASSAKKK